MVRYEDVPERFNVTEYFLDRNLEEGRGSRVALHCGDRAVTYEELARLTNRVGSVLQELGVEGEDRVLLALADGVEFVPAGMRCSSWGRYPRRCTPSYTPTTTRTT